MERDVVNYFYSKPNRTEVKNQSVAYMLFNLSFLSTQWEVADDQKENF